jgi:hypothetical protein
MVYTKVSELICSVTGYWDVGLLNDLFNTVDVKKSQLIIMALITLSHGAIQTMDGMQ